VIQRFNNKHKLALLIASAPMALALSASPAAAQTAAAEEETPTDIVVTGSRISRPDLTSNTPLSVISGDTFQQQGSVNVESVINLLPQVTPGLNANVNNGGNGTVSVDLRGLGPSRTLVLANGRRVVPSNNTGVVDLNVIPPELIERVEVVTGGSSATYGSDAVAGVVNFILKKNFEGVQLNGQYDISQEGDSRIYTVGGIIGSNLADGRGNVTAAFSYTDRSASFQSARSFLAVDQNGGSATGTAGRFDNAPLNPFAGGAGNQVLNADGSVRPFINQLPDANGVGDRYNFAPVNYIQTPQQRTTVNVLGHYEIVPTKIDFFVEALYVNSRVALQLAETPATGLLVSPTSPLLSPSALALAAGRPDPTAPLIFRRRLVEVGPRQQTFDFNDYQLTLGLRGDLNNNLKYEVYWAYGRVDSSQGIFNDASRQRLTAGLNGCPVGSPAGCVPVNAFGPGNISTAAADYIRVNSAVDQFTFQRQNVVASLSGNVPQLDLGAGPVGFAVGYEYREDKSSFNPSDPSQRGDITGFNAQSPIRGSFNSNEVFGELRIPVLKDIPFAKEVTLELAGRYSDYSSVGGQYTFNAGGEWTPVEKFRIRGLYSRATRAPSVFELFQAGDQNFPQVNDPCFARSSSGAQRAPVSASVAATCVASGGLNPLVATTAAQTNAQIEARNIGNPNLDAETSTTYTVGGVYTPLRNLSFSIDYFNIGVDGYVSRAFGGAQGLVNACFNSGATAANFATDPACRFVTRDLGGNLLIQLPLANSSNLSTSGIDFALNYTHKIGGLFGFLPEDAKLNFNGNLTYQLSYQFDGTEFSGFASGDFGTLPHIRSNSRLTYSGSALTATLNWRYIGGTLDTFGDSPSAGPDGFGEIRAQNYFDLSGTYKINPHFEFFGGVLNLSNVTPPSVNAGFTATNTDETLYDIVGRRFFFGAKLRF
jgi:outer membrane receptor protein involved in Fe transport